MVSQWQCYFYVTDGWKVYPQFIPNGDQIVSFAYMTRVVRAASPLGRRRKYEIKALFGSVKAKDALLFQIPSNASTFSAITHSLSQV